MEANRVKNPVRTGGNHGGTGNGKDLDALGMLQVMWTLDHAMQVRSRRMARQLGVTGPQRLALRVLAAEQIASPGELARRLVLHKSTVTGIVARLEQRGLIERARRTDDGRRLALALTPGGRKAIRSRAGTIESAVAHAIESASPAEVRHTSAFLRRLAAALLPLPGTPRRVGKRAAAS
jgi:DNA-binding MarR family transcriptional regulator